MHPLLARILDSPWLISPSVAQSYLPLLLGLQEGRLPALPEGQSAAELRELGRPQDFALAFAGGQLQAAVPVAAGGGSPAKVGGDPLQVRVIAISGPLMKDDQLCGPIGMSSLARYVQSASQNPDIDAIIFKIDSPGGQVYGTQTLADAIRQCQKPTVALCDDGTMCSAAYWIGSSCDEILATHETCVIGSIGVMASWADKQGQLEKDGVVFHEVYATQSTKKNADFAAAKAGDYGPLQARLSAICDQFIGAVQANRGERLDQQAVTQAGAFAGDTFSASEAQELGLIDGLGSLQEAFARCGQLVQQRRAASTTASSTNSSKMGFFDKKATLGAAMMALVGAETVTAEQVTAANAELAAGGITGAALLPTAAFDELQATAGQLATMTTAHDTAQASLQAMTDALATAGAKDVATLAAERDEWKGKAETYGNQPGAMGTSAEKQEGDKQGEPNAADANAKLVADLHAKMLGE